MITKKPTPIGRECPRDDISVPFTMPVPWFVWDTYNPIKCGIVNCKFYSEALELGNRILQTSECHAVSYKKIVDLCLNQ